MIYETQSPVSYTPEENEPPAAGGIKGIKDVCNLISAKYHIKGSVAALIKN